jgi:hypothetical protein
VVADRPAAEVRRRYRATGWAGIDGRWAGYWRRGREERFGLGRAGSLAAVDRRRVVRRRGAGGRGWWRRRQGGRKKKKFSRSVLGWKFECLCIFPEAT